MPLLVFFFFFLIYLFLAVLVSVVAQRLSLVAESRGYSLVAVLGLLIAAASLVAKHGLWGMCAQQLRCKA